MVELCVMPFQWFTYYMLFFCVLVLACSTSRQKELIGKNDFVQGSSVLVLNLDGGKLYESKRNYDDTSYFEGASLSKTVFAMRISSLIESLSKGEADSIYGLINHSLGVERKDSSMLFNYSDSSYLLAYSFIREWTHKELKDIARGYPFVYQRNMRLLDGYIQGNAMAREARREQEAMPNGSLYINKKIAVKLLEETVNWVSNFEQNKLVKVDYFQHLYWTNGVGLDSSFGRPIYFQWGSNWCYNHLLLIDPDKNSHWLILTNSVIGAHEIAGFMEKQLGKRAEFFDFIHWY